jgi:hypothetical protein
MVVDFMADITVGIIGMVTVGTMAIITTTTYILVEEEVLLITMEHREHEIILEHPTTT